MKPQAKATVPANSQGWGRTSLSSSAAVGEIAEDETLYLRFPGPRVGTRNQYPIEMRVEQALHESDEGDLEPKLKSDRWT